MNHDQPNTFRFTETWVVEPRVTLDEELKELEAVAFEEYEGSDRSDRRYLGWIAVVTSLLVLAWALITTL